MDQNNELWETESFARRWMNKGLEQPAAFLLVLWGWSQFLNYFRFFLVRVVSFSYVTCKSLEYATNGLSLLVLAFTLYYLWVHRSWFKGRDVKLMTTVWLGMLVSMVLVNVMQQNVLHHVIFELQHALFMLLTAFAIVLTGRIIDHRTMFLGGLAFALLALGASFFALKYQMLMEAVGWLLGFVVPGHMMLRKSA